MLSLRGAVLTCGAALRFTHPMTAAAQHPDSIQFTVLAPASVRRGEPVPIALHLTNAGDRPVQVYLTGRTITFDIVVARPDGHVVWRRLEGKAGQQILQVKTLAPRETLELKDVWTHPVDPGDYTVQGVLPTDREPLRTAVVPLRIVPR